jgi:hypothetical protein
LMQNKGVRMGRSAIRAPSWSRAGIAPANSQTRQKLVGALGEAKQMKEAQHSRKRHCQMSSYSSQQCRPCRGHRRGRRSLRQTKEKQRSTKPRISDEHARAGSKEQQGQELLPTCAADTRGLRRRPRRRERVCRAVEAVGIAECRRVGAGVACGAKKHRTRRTMRTRRAKNE